MHFFARSPPVLLLNLFYAIPQILTVLSDFSLLIKSRWLWLSHTIVWPWRLPVFNHYFVIPIPKVPNAFSGLYFPKTPITAFGQLLFTQRLRSLTLAM